MSIRTLVTTVIGSNKHVVGTCIPGISRRVPQHRLRQAILVVLLVGLNLIRKAFA